MSQSHLRRLEARLEALLARTPVAEVVEPRRAVRFAEYALVGLSGAAIDVGLTASLLGTSHYLVANALGFLVANSWNFGWNHRVTFDAADGPLSRLWAAYLSWHALTFAVRAVVVAGLVEAGGVATLPASVVGIGAASIANFLGSERIFGTSTASPEQLRISLTRTINGTVHALYTGRLRDLVVATGLYTPLYGAYQRVLGLLYPSDTIEISAAGVSTELYMEFDAEVLSVLHTLRKEREFLEEFTAAIGTDDVVWDVGANLGVFSLLAAERARDGHVVAIEPYIPTALRLEESVELAEPAAHVDVVEAALSDTTGWVALGVDRAEIGTQTPTLEPRPGQQKHIVEEVAGDELVEHGDLPAPTVVKIDVEGAECQVIDGLEETLSRPQCRLVYCEDHADAWGGDGAVDGLQERLEALGFDVEVVHEGLGQAYLKGART